ncbi:ALDO1 oxidase, partial [Acromyrmex heyeri]
LYNIAKTDSILVLGGSLTLTTALETFQKYSNDTGFKYLSHLAQHVEIIANVPVRNIGTIAGNLMLKYQHKEFPSDLFRTERTGTSDPSRSARDSVEMGGAGVDPKEEGMGILREEKGEGIVPREQERNNRGFLG